jgi:hypothetical protein
LHLAGEIAAGEDAGTLPEAIGNLVRVGAFERGSNTQTRSAGLVLDDDKLAPLRLGNVGEEIMGLVWTGSAAASRGYSASGMRGHMRHGSARAAGRIGVTAVPREDVGLSHIITTSGAGLAGRARVLLVMVAAFVALVAYIHRAG